MAFKHKQKDRFQQSGLHAYIATPAYDGKVECNYSQSLAEAAFCAPLYGIRITAGVMGNGAFIDLARNIFVKRFLEEYTDTSHLFFIDADLRFQPNAFIGLMEANLPICAGSYRRRQDPEDYPLVFADAPGTGGLLFENDWLMCKRVATGFLCIRRDVLTEMAKDAPQVNIPDQKGPVPWVFHTKFDEQNRFIGEDYAFCDDYVAKYGKFIPVWPNFDFIHGGYSGNLSAYLERKYAEHVEKRNEFGRMKTGPFRPEGHPYPGVFIAGDTALAWAGWLKATPEQREEMSRYGAGDPIKKMIAVLESCYVEPAA